jgi:hypothetical protein
MNGDLMGLSGGRSNNTKVGHRRFPAKDVEHQSDALNAEHIISASANQLVLYDYKLRGILPICGNLNLELWRLVLGPLRIILRLQNSVRRFESTLIVERLHLHPIRCLCRGQLRRYQNRTEPHTKLEA